MYIIQCMQNTLMKMKAGIERRANENKLPKIIHNTL